MPFSTELTRNLDDGSKMMGKHPLGTAPAIDVVPYISHILDDFESPFEVVSADRTPPDGLGWRNSQTDTDGNARDATLSRVTDTKLYGTTSVQVERLAPSFAPASEAAFQLFLNSNQYNGSNDYRYLKEDPSVVNDWVDGTVNRMRSWFKAPATMRQSAKVGNTNFHIASFIRRAGTSRTKNESDNGHYYHYYNLGYEGSMWHQILTDPKPSHQRSSSGTDEHEALYEPFPDTDPGRGYFDTMVYFYWHFKLVESAAVPAKYNWDQVEFFQQEYDEDVENIYSLWGIFNDITNEIVIGWKRIKALSTKSFHVKYAYSSFHIAGGFDNHGWTAPNGEAVLPYSTFTPNGYNGVEYREVVNTGGKDYIYMAIKQEDSATRFREIRIPVTVAGYPVIGGE